MQRRCAYEPYAPGIFGVDATIAAGSGLRASVAAILRSTSRAHRSKLVTIYGSATTTTVPSVSWPSH